MPPCGGFRLSVFVWALKDTWTRWAFIFVLVLDPLGGPTKRRRTSLGFSRGGVQKPLSPRDEAQRSPWYSSVAQRENRHTGNRNGLQLDLLETTLLSRGIQRSPP